MNVQRHELARAVDKVRSIVQKNDQIPALGGVLVEDGYITASNQEITMQVKLEASRDIPFILPMRAFDLIKNMPDGEIEVTADDKNVVTVRMDTIRNEYRSFPPEDFVYKKEAPAGKGVTLPGREFREALSRVIFAAADKPYDMMGGIHLNTEGGKLNIVALNGHAAAWDSIDAEGLQGMDLIIPKPAMKKLIDMDIDDDIYLAADKNGAVFRTGKYVVFARLIEGRYYNYRAMFKDGRAGELEVGRKVLTAALNRAKMCCTEEKQPVVLTIGNGQIRMKAADTLTNYAEDIPSETDFEETLRIGFDSKVLLESLRAFSMDRIHIRFIGQKAPAYLTEEGNNLTVLVLPVAIH